MLKTCVGLAIVAAAATTLAAQDMSKVTMKFWPAGGAVSMIEADGDFAGGNVAASIGPDGILLVDDMYSVAADKLTAALKMKSDLPIRIVINSHFHGDHIQANSVFGKSATIIAHENVAKRLSAAKPLPYPIVTFADSTSVRFNGENITVRHFPSSHTDSDAVIFFETSKVLHLGDMFFQGMFPAVYTEGGGDIRQLIRSLDTVLAEYPADSKVVPGHGALATMGELRTYVTMLKETVAAGERAVASKKSAEDLANDPALKKYAALGAGGAQTLPQYSAMLLKLLATKG